MVPLSERTVLGVLQRAAKDVPERAAVIDEEQELTYADLLDQSLIAGGTFRSLGVEHQQPVMLMLDNHIDHALAWFGLSCTGAVEVPINTAFKGPQLSYIANHCQAEILVIEAEYLPRLQAEIDDLRDTLTHVIVRGEPDAELVSSLPFEVLDFSVLRKGPIASTVDVQPWDLLGIMYTSGTTGRSKGVEVTQAQTYGRMWPLEIGAAAAGDVTLVTLPLYHVIGQCRGLYNTLIAQGTAVIERRFSASGFWDTCRRHGVTYVPLVGAQATYLLRQPVHPDDRDNPVERMCFGTTIPEVDEFRQRFDVQLTCSYGLTEAGGVLVGRAESQGCGWLRSDFEGRLVDDHDVEVTAGDTGELVLRSTEPWAVMAGYHRMPDATAEKWRNLWLHTGDLMFQRDDGMFIFVDRKADSIRIRGENVSSFEVEQAILEHPDVHDCAVVPIAGDSGESDHEIKAVIVPSSANRPDEGGIIAFLADRLPYYSVPRYLEFRTELPRTESTQRVKKALLTDTEPDGAWDRVAAGFVVTRDGLEGPSERS